MLKTISVHSVFFPGLSLEFSCIELSMNNLSSYCGLVDAKIRVSDKDLPVLVPFGPSVKSSCFSSGRYFSYGTWLFKGAEAGRRRVMLGELVGCITIFAFLFLGCAAYGATSGL